MSAVNDALKQEEGKLKQLVTLQDMICGLRPDKMISVQNAVQSSGYLQSSDDIAMLANIVIECTKVRPSAIENHAKLARFLCDHSEEFKAVLRRQTWEHIKAAEVQFFAAQLLEMGVLNAQYLIERVRRQSKLTLDPELVFYFFPEWATDAEFFEIQLENHKPELAQWDEEYMEQCQDKLFGTALARDNYRLFREHRLRGMNHNGVARTVRLDDLAMLKMMFEGGSMTPESEVPRSLFDRHTIGKSKTVPLIAYSAYMGGIQCFRYLIQQNVKVPDDISWYACYGGNHEIIQLLEQRGHSLQYGMGGCLRAYHFSVFKFLIEHKGVPVDIDALKQMLEFKYKGLYYLLWKQQDIRLFVANDPDASDDINYEGRLLSFVVKNNDTFFCKALMAMPGLDIMTPTKLKHHTPLHVAAAANSLEALRTLLSGNGVNVNSEEGGESPLICAVRNNAVECVQELCNQSGIEVNKMFDDKTPLMEACDSGSIEITKILVATPGIDAKIKNSKGLTAQDFAKKSGATKCLEIIAPLFE